MSKNNSQKKADFEGWYDVKNWKQNGIYLGNSMRCGWKIEGRQHVYSKIQNEK